MIKQLLEEVRAAPLDEASRGRLREIHQRSIIELEDGLAPELREELERLSLPFEGDTPPSEAELRIAQAQLVGWLEGLFHGIQAALVAQQMAARLQLEQMRGGGGRPALPMGPSGIIPGMPGAGHPGAGHPGESAAPANTCYRSKTFPQVAGHAVLVVRAGRPRRPPRGRRGGRCPSPPTGRPRPASGCRSACRRRRSPRTRRCPRCSQSQASPAALVTPAAEISTSALDDEWVASAIPPSVRLTSS